MKWYKYRMHPRRWALKIQYPDKGGLGEGGDEKFFEGMS
jgi:hypothetical protein